MIKDAVARARKYLVESLNTDDEVDEFIELHMDELQPSYWKEHTGKTEPSVSEILDLLIARDPVDYDDLAMVDFLLPGDVSQYVLSVRVSAAGLESISMES